MASYIADFEVVAEEDFGILLRQNRNKGRQYDHRGYDQKVASLPATFFVVIFLLYRDCGIEQYEVFMYLVGS